MRYAFQTVDVFTETRFGGNPLAVFPHADGLSDQDMQSLAAEFNLSETTFVLAPRNSAHTARIRIFNRTAEMDFAGHPCIGTAFVLATADHVLAPMRFEVPAGIVAVDLERHAGVVTGGRLTAPQPLKLGESLSAHEIARCLGLQPSDIVVDAHPPIAASVGNSYVIAQVTEDGLSRCVPNLRAFREALAARPHMNGRFSLHVYAGSGDTLRARMFAPIAGTIEEPATGSANAPLAGLLLSVRGGNRADFTIHQGIEMGRPSLLRVTAFREGDRITTTVAGSCLPVLVGHALVGSEDPS